MEIELATPEHLDDVETLYNDINDYLDATKNFPGWVKGDYPVRATAMEAVGQQSLFVCLINNLVVGSVILNHKQEAAYQQGCWHFAANNDEVIVVHTLAVHPQYMKQGVAEKLMHFAKQYAIGKKAKVIRLDTFTGNQPAIRLYEKLGYQYAGTVDLGLNIPGFVWFRLYELAL